MSPRHQLIVSVAIVVAVIAVAWIMLFQRNVLTPPMIAPTGPTLPELGKEFDAGLERFNKLLAPATPATGGSASGGNAPTNAAPVNVAPVNIPPPATSDDVQASPQ